jgi:hypothetical protein
MAGNYHNKKEIGFEALIDSRWAATHCRNGKRAALKMKYVQHSQHKSVTMRGILISAESTIARVFKTA